MKTEDLKEIKDVIGGLRFMQAAALVASGMNEDKDAMKYMSKLGRLVRAIDQEIDSRDSVVKYMSERLENL